MVAGYVGQTAIEVSNVLNSAKGGVLFIDEAYSLSNGISGDYGMEAIETLLKRMEDEREDLIVIVAGYPQLMERFDFLQPRPPLPVQQKDILPGLYAGRTAGYFAYGKEEYHGRRTVQAGSG